MEFTPRRMTTWTLFPAGKQALDVLIVRAYPNIFKSWMTFIRFVVPNSCCEEYLWFHIFPERSLAIPPVSPDSIVWICSQTKLNTLVNSSLRCISLFPELIHPILAALKLVEQDKIAFNTPPPSDLRRRSWLLDHDERSLSYHLSVLLVVYQKDILQKRYIIPRIQPS